MEGLQPWLRHLEVSKFCQHLEATALLKFVMCVQRLEYGKRRFA